LSRVSAVLTGDPQRKNRFTFKEVEYRAGEVDGRETPGKEWDYHVSESLWARPWRRTIEADLTLEKKRVGAVESFAQNMEQPFGGEPKKKRHCWGKNNPDKQGKQPGETIKNVTLPKTNPDPWKG